MTPEARRRPGETADQYVRRLTARPDAWRLLGSEEGQRALEQARREAAEARRRARSEVA